MTPGKFITFEGGEGAGKSTQVAFLARALEEAGLDVCTTREPGGADAAEDIRGLLLDGEVDRWLPISEALLNYAARAEHIDGTISPALESGAWVLCDRFYDSTFAYQGWGHGLDEDKLQTLNDLVLGKFQPDLTVVLDIEVEAGLARAFSRSGGEDRYERMDVDFHRRIRQAFLTRAQRDPIRCVVISAEAPVEAIQTEIRRVVGERFGVLLS